MFRIDKSSVSYKKDEHPFVLAHAAMMRPAPVKLPQLEEQKAAPAQPEAPPQPEREPEVIVELPDPAELVENARKEAEAIVAAAKTAAAKISAQATLAADEMKNDALREGTERGYAEGFAKGRGEGAAAYSAAMQDAQKVLDSVVARVEEERTALYSAAEQQCVSLAVDVAQKVIGTALELDENAFPALVRRALEEIQSEGRVTVRVSPLQYEIFFAENPKWLSDESRTVTVVPDEGLPDDGLRLESEIEAINAGVREQMNAIRAAIAQLGGGQT